MWLRKPVECRKASSQSERATVFGRNRRLTFRSGRHVSSTLPVSLVLGVLALTGCAAPGINCQTYCHVPAMQVVHGPHGKHAHSGLRHRKGHAWAARTADFGYSRTYWHRFPVESMHGPLPWTEEIPAAESVAPEPQREETPAPNRSIDQEEPDFLPDPRELPFDQLDDDEAIDDEEVTFRPPTANLPTVASVSDEEGDTIRLPALTEQVGPELEWGPDVGPIQGYVPEFTPAIIGPVVPVADVTADDAGLLGAGVVRRVPETQPTSTHPASSVVPPRSNTRDPLAEAAPFQSARQRTRFGTSTKTTPKPSGLLQLLGL